MALRSSSTAAVFILVLVLAVVYSATPVTGLGGKVGVRTKIKDVETNKKVQELGRYSVEEYNRRQKKQSESGYLKFSRVVEADEQVVSGIKYYLKIEATVKSNRVKKTFDAVVVVKQWMHSKELLNFDPSPK